MTSKHMRLIRILSTFDGSNPPATPAPQVIVIPGLSQQPAPAQAPAPAAPQPGIPAELVGAMLQTQQAALAEVQQRNQMLQQAALQGAQITQQPVPPVGVNPQPAAPAQAPAAQNTDQLAALTAQVAQLTEQNRVAALQAHRGRLIAGAAAQGIPIIDSLVYGNTEAELNASLQLAAAEYVHFQARVMAEAQARGQVPQQAPFVVQAPAPPAGVPMYAQPTAANVQPGFQQQQLAHAVPALTTAAAIRSGSYGQQRSALFDTLRGYTGGNDPQMLQQAAVQAAHAAQGGQMMAFTVPQAHAASPYNTPAPQPGYLPPQAPQHVAYGPPQQQAPQGYFQPQTQPFPSQQYAQPVQQTFQPAPGGYGVQPLAQPVPAGFGASAGNPMAGVTLPSAIQPRPFAPPVHQVSPHLVAQAQQYMQPAQLNAGNPLSADAAVHAALAATQQYRGQQQPTH